MPFRSPIPKTEVSMSKSLLAIGLVMYNFTIILTSSTSLEGGVCVSNSTASIIMLFND